MLGAPYPVSVRLRSNSSPARPRASLASPSVAAEEDSLPPQAHGHKPTSPTESKKPTSQKSKFKRGSLSGFQPEQQPQPSGPFRVFRRKRPSTSGGLPQQTVVVDAPHSREGSLSPKSPRAKGSRRPSTSSGVAERSHSPHQAPRMSPTESRRRNGSSPPPGFESTIIKETEPALGAQGGKVKVSAPQLVIPIHPSPPRELQSTTTKVGQDRKGRTPMSDLRFKYKNNKRHHVYPPQEVPYPRSYEFGPIDSDIWETLWVHDACGDLSVHHVDVLPRKVLDLGCGTGSWIFDCAALWKETEFVGLDIMPIQLNLVQLGWTELASRITWVQHNFLKPLPFPDEEFDLIHAKRISRGVPEDKWYPLLEELHRILKTGGKLEFYDEELYFPGKAIDPHGAEPMSLLETLPYPPEHPPHVDNSSLSDYSSIGSASQLQHHAPRLQTDRPIPRTLSGTILNVGATLTNHSGPVSPPGRSKSPLPFSRVLDREPLQVALELPEQAHFQYAKTPMKEPINPRDHSLLEVIYNEMHASRFINLEPLALLRNALPLYFSDVCCHPPLIMAFPPRAPPIRTPGGPLDPDTQDTTLHGPLDESEKLSYAKPQIVTLMSVLFGVSPYLKFDDDRLNAYFRKQTPESLEDLKKFLQNPGGKSLVDYDEAFTGIATHSSRCHMPTDNIKFDVRTLPLHLQLRVHEVLGCVEAMWEWVLEYQSRQTSSGTTSGRVSQPFHEMLVDMTRVEYDEYVGRFELDMEEHMGIGAILRDGLSWSQGRPSRTQARKDFEQLCAEWALHQRAQRSLLSTSDTLFSDNSGSSTAAARPRKTSSLTSRESHASHEGSDTSPSFLKPSERVGRKVSVLAAWK